MSLDKIGIAKRIAQELKDGWYVNLGIGIPTLVANYVPKKINVEFINLEKISTGRIQLFILLEKKLVGIY